MFKKNYLIVAFFSLLFASIVYMVPTTSASIQGYYPSFHPIEHNRSVDCAWNLMDISSLGNMVDWIKDKLCFLFTCSLFQGNGPISSYLLNAIFKSILILLLALLIWKLGKMTILGLSKRTKFIKARYPDFKSYLSYYTKMIRKTFNGLMILLTILFLLQAWGLQVFHFLSEYSAYIYSLIRIPLILVLAILLLQISKFIISKLERLIQARMESRPGASKIEIEKQIRTIGEIIYKTVLITVWIVAVMMILKEMGFDIKPILAGAGIVGLAVGFGAQNLVRDVISGLFMIIENQVRVGDVAILNGTGGLVEAVNLRTTVLRGLDGAVHIFPNGTINTLSNLTHNFSFYIFDVGVAYKENVDHVIEILKKISDEIMADPTYAPEILEPLEILGLDKFGNSAIIIKARIKTKPIKQWLVGREMNRRIKQRFDEENIEIPFPHQTVYFGEASKPFGIRLEGDQESEALFKRWIREILAEKSGK